MQICCDVFVWCLKLKGDFIYLYFNSYCVHIQFVATMKNFRRLEGGRSMYRLKRCISHNKDEDCSPKNIWNKDNTKEC